MYGSLSYRVPSTISGTSGESTASASSQRPDPIDTVMWLFGYSVGKAGEHVMYGDALTSFGFALDAECRNNPNTSLLQALGTVRPKRDKPMQAGVVALDVVPILY